MVPTAAGPRRLHYVQPVEYSEIGEKEEEGVYGAKISFVYEKDGESCEITDLKDKTHFLVVCGSLTLFFRGGAGGICTADGTTIHCDK